MILDPLPFLASSPPVRILLFPRAFDPQTVSPTLYNLLFHLLFFMKRFPIVLQRILCFAFAFASKQHKRAEKENAGGNFTHPTKKVSCAIAQAETILRAAYRFHITTPAVT
jgi:hypothetical protein